MTNQDFCYWLQGYFEISRATKLTKAMILSIDGSLRKINEPLGDFTQWLSDITTYFASLKYNQEILSYFTPEISGRLNDVFYHVIDNSYDTNLSAESAKKIHDGVAA